MGGSGHPRYLTQNDPLHARIKTQRFPAAGRCQATTSPEDQPFVQALSRKPLAKNTPFLGSEAAPPPPPPANDFSTSHATSKTWGPVPMRPGIFRLCGEAGVDWVGGLVRHVTSTSCRELATSSATSSNLQQPALSLAT